MLAHERVREQPCGCRYDVVRGTTTHYCREHERHPFPWWFDYATAEVVRSADGQRWRVEDVTPLTVRGEVDMAAVDRWVLGQPGLDPPAPPADPALDRARLTEYGRAITGG